MPGPGAGGGGAEPKSVGARSRSGPGIWAGMHSLDRGGKTRHLVGHGLHILHNRQQLLLLGLQNGVLLPELQLKLGWVCWFHRGQNVLLRSEKEPDADQDG